MQDSVTSSIKCTHQSGGKWLLKLPQILWPRELITNQSWMQRASLAQSNTSISHLGAFFKNKKIFCLALKEPSDWANSPLLCRRQEPTSAQKVTATAVAHGAGWDNLECYISKQKPLCFAWIFSNGDTTTASESGVGPLSLHVKLLRK